MSVPIGLLSVATYIPEPRMTSAQISAATGIPQDILERKFGLLEKPLPGPDDHTCAMGAKAATTALERAGVAPEEVDLVLSVSEEHKEHPMMVSGIKIQQLVGARNAWAVDVAQRCCTLIAALKMARAMMRDDPRLRTVLVAGGYRNSDLIDYTNPRVSFMYNLAAAGGACVLRRDHAQNVLLEAELVSDGDFADDVNVPAGGTVQPLTPETVGGPASYLEVHGVAAMKARLGERSHTNFMHVIRESVRRSGYAVSDLDYVALLHMKRSAHAAVLAELGLGLEQSVYLERYGHIGQLDPILSIELALAQGRLKDGDLLVMASAGVSYAWGAQVIRWG